MDEAEVDDWLIEEILDLLNDPLGGKIRRDRLAVGRGRTGDTIRAHSFR